MAQPKKTEPAKTPKQLAAEARAASEAAEKRRERTIRIVGAVVVVLVVAGLLAVGFFAGRDDAGGNSATPAPTADPNAAVPSGVSTENWGVPYGAGWTAQNEAKLPTLEIWQDFQCPACAAVENQAGDQIQALADEAKVKLLYRPATFLDSSLASENTANGNPNSSARAAAAWGCAIDAGKAGEYHAGVFAMQPENEGVGYSDQQLKDLAGQVGISGADLTTFTTCYDQGTYLPWTANSQQAFLDAGVGGTPTGYLNGVELDSSQLADVESLEQMIANATAK